MMLKNNRIKNNAHMAYRINNILCKITSADRYLIGMK